LTFKTIAGDADLLTALLWDDIPACPEAESLEGVLCKGLGFITSVCVTSVGGEDEGVPYDVPCGL
jgi:hypothetical protein